MPNRAILDKALQTIIQCCCTDVSGRAPDEAAGSALRLLHQLAAAEAGGEALARATPPLVAALQPALVPTAPPAAAALAMETLQRALSPGNRYTLWTATFLLSPTLRPRCKQLCYYTVAEAEQLLGAMRWLVILLSRLQPMQDLDTCAGSGTCWWTLP